MKKILAANILVFYTLGCANLLANDNLNTNQIVVNHGKYSDYYHIKYTLKKNNFNLEKNGFSGEDGQFEIYLNKNNFPVSSPNCKDELILRMPSTLSDNKNRNKSIKEKNELYKKIKNVNEGNLNELDVIIELNPYIKVKNKTPLTLELEKCNIFFRTKKNNYINTLD